MPLFLPPSRALPPPPPARTRAARVVAVGTAVWVVLLLVALLVPAAPGSGDPLWAWTCGAGVLLGVLGWAFLARLERRERRG